MGTVIKKVNNGGGVGYDYSTLQSAEDSLPADFSVDGNAYVLELYKDGGRFGGSNQNWLVIGGITTTATYNLTVRAAAGHGWNTNPNVRTNRFAYVESQGVAVKGAAGYSYVIEGGNAAYVTYDGLQLSGLGGSQNGINLGNYSTIKNSIIYAQGQWGQRGHGIVRFSGSSGLAYNCLLLAYAGTGSTNGYGQGQLRSCTIVYRADQTDTSGHWGPQHDMINCALFGWSQQDTRAFTYGASDFTAIGTSDVSTSQMGLVYADQFMQVNMAGGLEDFRPKSTSQLSANGTNDSANVGAYDPTGTPRGSNWTIGAWQLDTYTGPINGTLNKTLANVSFSGTGNFVQLPTTGTLNKSVGLAAARISAHNSAVNVVAQSLRKLGYAGRMTQPQQFVQINRANPDAQFLKAFWHFGGDNLRPVGFNQATPTLYTNPTFRTGVDGREVMLNNVAMDTGITTSQLGIDGSNKRTIIVDYDYDTTLGGDEMSVFASGTNSGNQDYSIIVKGGFNIKLNLWGSDYNFTIPSSSGGLYRVWLACGYDGVNNFFHSVVQNKATGVFTRGTGLSGATPATTNTNVWLFGNGPGNGWNRYNNAMRKVMVFGGYAMPNAQFERIIRQPWALLANTRPYNRGSTLQLIGTPQTNLSVGLPDTQSNTASAGVIQVTRTLVGAASTQGNTSNTGVVSLIRTLTGATTSQGNTSSTGAVGQVTPTVTLTGASSSQGNTSSTGVISMVLQIVASATSQANTSNTGVIARTVGMTGAASSVANTSSTGTVSSVHVLLGALSSQSNTTSTGVETQVHTLAASATSQGNLSAVGQVALTRTLVAAASSQDNTSSTGSVGAIGSLSGDLSTQGNTASTSAVSVIHVLSGATSSVANTSNTDVIARTVALVGATSSQGNTSSTGVETQVHTLAASATSQANNATTGVIARTVALTGTTSSVGNTSNTGVITAVQFLTGANSVEANTSSAGAASSVHGLVGTTSSVANSASTGSVTLVRTLTGASSVQANTTDTGAVGGAGSLVGANSVSLNTSGTGAIQVTRTLTGAASTQANTSSTGVETQVHNLAASATSQSNVTPAAQVALTRILTGATTSQGNVASTGTVVSNGALIGAPSAQGNASNTGAITLVQTLSGSSTGQGASSSTGSISVTRTLTGGNTLQANASTTAAITKVVTLSGSDSIQTSLSSDGVVSAGVYLVGTYSRQDNSTNNGRIDYAYNLTGADSKQNNRTTMGGINGYGVVEVTQDEIDRIAAAVWDRQTSEHKNPGTFGKLMSSLLTVAKFLGLK